MSRILGEWSDSGFAAPSQTLALKTITREAGAVRFSEASYKWLTGYRLSIAQCIVLAMGGSLCVDSASGQGTALSFELLALIIDATDSAWFVIAPAQGCGACRATGEARCAPERHAGGPRLWMNSPTWHSMATSPISNAAGANQPFPPLRSAHTRTAQACRKSINCLLSINKFHGIFACINRKAN